MRAAVVFVVLLLAGCGESGLSPLPVMHVDASFPKGGIANLIVVAAVDRLALTGAVLVAPDGRKTGASDIDVQAQPSTGSQRLLGSALVAGEVFGTPTAPGAGSPRFLGGAPQASGRLLAVVSTASVPVEDPVGYARDWPGYKLHLTFGRPPGATEEREIAAPAPPPSG